MSPFVPTTVPVSISPLSETLLVASSSSSTESAGSSSPQMRVKRGRPQQEIAESEDPTSQRKKHRRLYARQYRAQIRSKVDEVKGLKEENEQLKRLYTDSIQKLFQAQKDVEQTRLELIESQKQVMVLNAINQMLTVPTTQSLDISGISSVFPTFQSPLLLAPKMENF